MPIIGSVPGVTGTDTAQTAVRTPKQDMDGELFMKLLIVQLQNQDPSAPMDTNDMIGQTTALAQMEKLTSLTEQMDESFGVQMRTAAAALIGQQVSYIDAESGETVTGTASAVSFAGPVPVVKVGDADIPLDQISGINTPGAAAATAAAASTSAARIPSGSVAGYGGDQLQNAAAILDAGAKLGLSVRDQTIGVMTAMGESSLKVIDHGDAAGPDSRGLFQQRDNGAWGTYSDRMDPTRSATMFFESLARVDGRDSMAPTEVAHRVQRNADPTHYAKYWDAAVAVVASLRTNPQA